MIGKSVENLQSRVNENDEQFSLPMTVPNEETCYQLFRGKNIAIFEGQIIAIDPSLQKLKEKLELLIPDGKRCLIEYIDEGAAIYGFDL